MTPALGSDESHVNVLLTVRDTDHNFQRVRRTEEESNQGPAYQPNALPLGQMGSLLERKKELFQRIAHEAAETWFVHECSLQKKSE